MSRIPMLDNIYGQPASHRALLELHERSQQATLQACAKLIREARGNVVFTGMGGSLFATMAAVSRLAQQGYAVQAMESRASRDPGRDQIRITGRREGAVVVIEVSDTGPGFSEKARAHLFEAFQGSTRPGGTGLGLAIAAELVRAHGGEVRLVEGTIGATLRLTIPDRAVELSAHRGARAHG